MRSRVVAVAGIVCATVGSALTLGSPQHPAGAIFERYAAGDVNNVAAELLRGRSFDRAVRDFRRDADRWIAQVSSEERPRAVPVAATVALDLLARGAQGWATDYSAARPLVEWMCAHWRSLPPSHAERLFHRGVVAVLQGVDDAPLLVGQRVAGVDAAPHLLHAAARFPDDPRFKLAWLVSSRHELQVIAAHPVMPAYLRRGNRLWSSGLVDSGQFETAPFEDTVQRLRELENLPEIRSEVQLRRGVLQFLNGRTNVALTDFEAVIASSGSSDQLILYLAHVMAGLSLERAGRLADSPKHYESAANIVSASSAKVAWQSSLFRLGRRAEARQIATLSDGRAKPEKQDPWGLYGLGDYRMLPTIQEALRAAIKP